jgi:oxygen-independent coproporphyrinogen-3 oxidase
MIMPFVSPGLEISFDEPMREISLYVHVPFCMRRCPYCTFFHVPHIDHFETAFVKGLIRELASAAEEIGEPFRCPTVFFGGGTPSVLRDESLDEVFDAIDPFLPDTDDVEITLEANPEDVTVDLLEGLRGRGVNRLSLGVQSMVPGALKVLKRCAAEVNARAIELAATHLDNYSIDVLLGIPGGTPADLQGTMERLADCAPPHFAVYCLEPGGVMGREEALGEGGYEHYEVSNFARPGYESRHNRTYWRGGEYLGLGPGAHSYIGGERFHNEPSIERYVSRMDSALRRPEPREDEERLIERRMLALRTSDGLALDQLECPRSVLDDLIAGGLAAIAGERLVLTDRGFLVLNEIVLRLTA